MAAFDSRDRFRRSLVSLHTLFGNDPQAAGPVRAMQHLAFVADDNGAAFRELSIWL